MDVFKGGKFNNFFKKFFISQLKMKDFKKFQFIRSKNDLYKFDFLKDLTKNDAQHLQRFWLPEIGCMKLVVPQKGR